MKNVNIELVVIDPQNDFCSPHGSLYVKGAELDMERRGWVDSHLSGLPWESHELDGGLTWNAGAWVERGANRWRETPRSPCKQGDAALRYKSGWTALAWHDYTGDQRGGSNSTLFANGIFSFQEMQDLLRQHFGKVADRQLQGFVLCHEDLRPSEETK